MILKNITDINSKDLYAVWSYGLMLFCKTDKKWAIVQRKHSVAFLKLMKCRFSISYIQNLLDRTTEEEKQMFMEFILTRDIAYLQRNNINHTKEDIVHINNVLDQYGDIFVSHVMNSRVSCPLEWTWPKGMKNYDEEPPLSVAYREFEEEVGVRIDKKLVIHDEHLNSITPVYSNKLCVTNMIHIKTTFFPVVVENICKNTTVAAADSKASSSYTTSSSNDDVQNHEVECVKWVSTAELDKYLDLSSYEKRIIDYIEKKYGG